MALWVFRTQSFLKLKKLSFAKTREGFEEAGRGEQQWLLFSASYQNSGQKRSWGNLKHNYSNLNWVSEEVLPSTFPRRKVSTNF